MQGSEETTPNNGHGVSVIAPSEPTAPFPASGITTAAVSPPTDKAKLPMSATISIIAACFGFLLICIAVAAAVWFYLRRKRDRFDPNNLQSGVPAKTASEDCEDIESGGDIDNDTQNHAHIHQKKTRRKEKVSSNAVHTQSTNVPESSDPSYPSATDSSAQGPTTPPSMPSSQPQIDSQTHHSTPASDDIPQCINSLLPADQAPCDKKVGTFSFPPKPSAHTKHSPLQQLHSTRGGGGDEAARPGSGSLKRDNKASVATIAATATAAAVSAHSKAASTQQKPLLSTSCASPAHSKAPLSAAAAAVLSACRQARATEGGGHPTATSVATTGTVATTTTMSSVPETTTATTLTVADTTTLVTETLPDINSTFTSCVSTQLEFVEVRCLLAASALHVMHVFLLIAT